MFHIKLYSYKNFFSEIMNRRPMLMHMDKIAEGNRLIRNLAIEKN